MIIIYAIDNNCFRNKIKKVLSFFRLLVEFKNILESRITIIIIKIIS
jgi:hypothetical protein